MKDFTPITLLTSTPTVLVVTPELGVKNVKELIALANAKPETISFGSSGVASSTHLALELFKSLARREDHPRALHRQPAGRDRSACRPDPRLLLARFDRDGACTGRQTRRARRHRRRRSPIVPELPTMIEAGVPNFESVLWFGLVAPAGTPQAIIDKLARADNEAFTSEDVPRSLQAQSVARIGGTPEEFRRHIESERASGGLRSCRAPA